jgi:4-azaleucine resistance transporter AzlC
MSSIYRTLSPRALRSRAPRASALPGNARRDIALALLAVWLIGLSYGAIAVASGFPLWFPAAQSVLVLAGASEFLFIGIVAAGGNPIAAALAGLLVNARHLPYGLALPDVLGNGWRRILGAHVMNDESVVFALAQDDPPAKRAAFWTCGLGVLICWPGGAILGALIGTAVRDTSALGLDAMFPAVILALIVPALRDRPTRHTALAGVAIALAAAPFLPAGLPVLLALVALLSLIPKRPSLRPTSPTRPSWWPTLTTRPSWWPTRRRPAR